MTDQSQYCAYTALPTTKVSNPITIATATYTSNCQVCALVGGAAGHATCTSTVKGCTPTTSTTSTTSTTPPPAPTVSPFCEYSEGFAADSYGIQLPARAVGVNADCAMDYLWAMQHRALAPTQWWCQPYDKNGKQVALSDPTADYVALTFEMTAWMSAQVQNAIGDASGQSVSINCLSVNGKDPDADVDHEPGESEPEQPSGAVPPGETDPDPDPDPDPDVGGER